MFLFNFDPIKALPMTNQNKNIVYSLILLCSMALVWWIRRPDSDTLDLQKQELSGSTMGTTYSVKYLTREPVNYQASIDSLLEDFNQCLSTYIEDSEISKFNQGVLHRFDRPYFYPVMEKSLALYQITGGAFDPTVMPLVSAWGFGPDSEDTPTAEEVDSLLASVGFDNVFFDEQAVCKLKPAVQLDFSAIAKGYAVDLVMKFLKTKGLENIFVEIGGEIAASGVNDQNKPWAVYIEKPLEGERSVQAVAMLDNIAVATSGNYRNYYIKDGKKYAHTISPFTGYPVQHSLLGVSVFAENCAAADAYATAFMVMGLDKAIPIVAQQTDIEAYFVYSDENGALKTHVTSGIENFIKE
jgi:thiamine biosynthesis lipoprotein